MNCVYKDIDDTMSEFLFLEVYLGEVLVYLGILAGAISPLSRRQESARDEMLS